MQRDGIQALMIGYAPGGNAVLWSSTNRLQSGDNQIVRRVTLAGADTVGVVSNAARAADPWGSVDSVYRVITVRDERPTE